MRRLLGVTMLSSALLVLSGCTGVGGGAVRATPTASTRATGAGRVIENFALYTHCGVREARVGADYYRADPVLDDGSGNPPEGWGNPTQDGTMTVRPDGTALFVAGELQARFVLRRGAKDWLQICS